MNCASDFLRNDLKNNHDIALVFFKNYQRSLKNKNIVTFSGFYQRVVKAQKYLQKLNFKKGDAILLFEKPKADFYAFLVAMMGLGIEAVMVEPWLSLKMIDKVIGDVQPKGFLATWVGRLWGMRISSIRKIPFWFSSKILHQENYQSSDQAIAVEMKPDDNAIISFTTGTSGAPKGVYRSHHLLHVSGKTIKKYLPTSKSFDLVFFPNLVLENFEMRRGSIIVDHSCSERVLKDLDKVDQIYPIKSMVGNPHSIKMLINSCELKNLEDVYIGGALGDCNLYEKAFEKWPRTKFTHVYGSSEAEPVAVADLKQAVKLSREAGYFQNIVLGNPIEEIKVKIQNDVLWVSGEHVSALYRGDEASNKKNKQIDTNGNLWHNMGDLVQKNEQQILWYQGRSFQTIEEFNLENKIYQITKSSASFIFAYEGDLALVGEGLEPFTVEIKKQFPKIKKIFHRKIYRDRRHQSRLDRDKTLKGL
jgi:acyl-coenzyme A synthetase/AMP-(fatty) acid ligase